jgi:type I restriction enzyme M protein
MSSNQSGEGEIRKAIIEADLVDCMIALPGQLFYSTQIPVCLWFLARDKRNAKFRERRGQTLFIDARKLGKMTDRVHLELTVEDVQRIAQTYHAWRGGDDPFSNPHSAIHQYENIPGFCNSATVDDIRVQGHVLTPGRYVGTEEVEDTGEPFNQTMQRLTATLKEQFAESSKLEKTIRNNLHLFLQ